MASDVTQRNPVLRWPRQRPLRVARIVSWAATALLGFVALAAFAADRAPGPVYLLKLDSAIQPAVAEFLTESLSLADDNGAELVVLELSTPGGFLDSTRDIFKAILNADTPVVVFVSPSGARAASAGFFLLMSADIAAMAPGTNTGAAHPVGQAGQDIEGDIGEKVEQDAAASIRSLAARNGRDLDLAESAVVESRSFSSEEALELGLIDLVATDLSDLLEKLDGRTIEKNGSEIGPLATKGATIESFEMTFFQRLRSTLFHPQIALLLVSLGGLGLYIEISNPGTIFPGVIGAIFLILGLYGVFALPVDIAGIALFALALVLFLLELKVPSFGLLTLGGIVSMVFGSLLLFRSADPAFQVGLQFVIVVAVFVGITTLLLGRLAARAYASRVQTGVEGLVAEPAVVTSDISPERGGKVRLHGELWNATASDAVATGQRVRVVAVDGMSVRVEPDGS